MTRLRSPIGLVVHVSLLGFFLTCLAQSSIARTLEDVRSAVTIERPYEFGTEIEIVAKKGDVIRLTLNENPSGRKEIFLLPKDDYLGWRIPSKWGVDHTSAGGASYDRHRERFLGLSFGTVLNLRFSEGSDKMVTIKVLIDHTKKLEPRLLENMRESAQRREEIRREANVISVDERLAGFARLWSEVKYNFAFFDQVPELDWDKVLEEYLPKIRKEQTTEEYYRLLEQCVAQLKDGHTTVYPPRIFRRRARLPVRLTAVEGKPIISEVHEAAAFTQPELKPGLEITHIDGRPVSEILEKDIYPYVADSTRQNRDRWAFRRLIQGEDGSEAVARVRRADGEIRGLKLTRLRWRYPRPPRFEYYYLGEGIAYVALNSFSSNEAPSLFGEAFDEIRQAKGLIIDVRNNGGGSTGHGNAVISYLIDEPLPGSSWKTRKYMPAFRAWGQKEAWHEGQGSTIQPRRNPYLGPVVVLTGPATVSAAEDFVVALHASGRARLVGEKTAGTTGQPLMIELPRGGRARICTKRDTYPDGREFVGIGVIPDVEVHPTHESIAAGRDAVLEKAVEVLAGQAGIHSIDAAVLSAQVVSQRRRKAPPQEGQARLAGILEQAKATYNALATAYAKADWNAIDAHGDKLSDLLRDELLDPMRLEQRRQRWKAEGRLNQQTEYDLLRWERRKKEIETFFGDETDMEDLHRLIAEIEDLSDDVHDCARDKQFGEIPKLFPELEKRWELLLSHMDKE